MVQGSSHSGIQTARISICTPVDVHTRFEIGRWVSGFTIAEVRDDGYRIKRDSDGAVLGEVVHPEEVRPAHGNKIHCG